MKKILIGLAATAAGAVMLLGTASAAETSYFVTKFEGSRATKLAFKSTGVEVSDIAFKSRIPCSGSGTLFGSFEPAELNDGRFASEVKPPVLQDGNLLRVRGSDVPGSPVGTLRIRAKTLKGKTCGKTMTWSASEVPRARWDRYRHRAGIG